jgi:hypothetical protein
MTEPLVSFCIPTWNRQRYLASLLESLEGQLAEFAYPYEIVIADNASTDATPQVVQQFTDRLPIRSLRHAENIGGYPNFQYVMTQGAGRYLVYLSDDDSLLGDQVADVIATMEADPELVVVYAPWLMYDLVAQQAQGQFYSVPHDVRIAQNDHGALLDRVLRHHIFPEIQITRRDAFHATMPRVNEPAFLAFVHSSDYLTKGAVMIRQQPFYVAITRYFADEEREQLGTDEVEHAWDRYRGGLEYMLARSGTQISPEERIGYQARIQQMIAGRMSVAVRLRHQKKRDPVDTYYIAMRLRGMGYESLLPVPLEKLAGEAMVGFLLRDPELRRGARQMLVVGATERGERDYMQRNAGLPVEFVDDLRGTDHLNDALVFVRDTAEKAQALDGAGAARRNVRLVHERDLAWKFGL